MESGGRRELEVIVVGAGLVGSLEALFLARRGHTVHIYEYREDIRRTPSVRGRSINLSLSSRGRAALARVGLADRLRAHAIPMAGRLIHRLDGSTYHIPYDAVSKQCIYSVGRNFLNALLLEESEKYPNVHRHFNHKLTDVDIAKGTLKFMKTHDCSVVETTADLVVGADGAYSSLRRAMTKQPLFDHSQQYIQHGYLELCIPADSNGGMPPNYLHIWPRGTFMMIALPNQDSSWTVTLFMPFDHFDSLDTPGSLLDFFCQHFPDAVPLIGKERLVEDFFAGKPSPLVAIKCRPHHIGDKFLLLGDAAHAIVPFYGQGMNAGFEDCAILDRLFGEHGDDIQNILREYSETRCKDVHAISDLAMYNYVEMRDLVTRPSFRLRKMTDNLLFSLLPTTWLPLYNSVTFTHMPYSECARNRQWQDKILFRTSAVLIFILIVVIGFTLKTIFAL